MGKGDKLYQTFFSIPHYPISNSSNLDGQYMGGGKENISSDSPSINSTHI